MTPKHDFSTGAQLPEDFDNAALTYREQGFLHIPQALSQDEVARFYAASLDLLELEPGTRWQTPDNPKTIMRYIRGAWRKSAILAELALHPRICAMAQRLTGRPLRLFSHEVVVKEPHESAPTEIHDDTLAIPVADSPVTLTVWIALVDVPVERGCLIFIPGSHLRKEVKDERKGVQSAYGSWPDMIWQPRITVPYRAGDCTFHDVRIVHMAGANETDELRLSSTATYVDMAATYLPTSMMQIPDLKTGQRLEDEHYPLLTDAVGDHSEPWNDEAKK